MSKFDEIAQKKKTELQNKQDADVERFAYKVAEKVVSNIDDLGLKESVANLAVAIAEAVSLSNENLNQNLDSNFGQLLEAVKTHEPKDIDASKNIGVSLAKLQESLNAIEFSPTVNFSGLTRDELAQEIDKLISYIPKQSSNEVVLAYENASPDKYINVRLTDGISFYRAGGGGVSVVNSGGSGGATEAKQDDVISELQTLNALVPSVYDYIDLSYTGDNLTSVVFKTGGSGGTTVSTLTLAYSGSNLTSVTKT